VNEIKILDIKKRAGPLGGKTDKGKWRKTIKGYIYGLEKIRRVYR